MSETTTTTTMKETTVLKKETKPATDEKMITCGVTGAVIGFFLGGPLLSALLGFIAAYASQKNDMAGEYARKLGEFGVSVKDKAVEVDAKHHVTERSRKVAEEAWNRAKQLDGKHNILDKTRDCVMTGWTYFVNCVHENRLLERGVECTGRGYEYVAEKIGSKGEKIQEKEH